MKTSLGQEIEHPYIHQEFGGDDQHFNENRMTGQEKREEWQGGGEQKCVGPVGMGDGQDERQPHGFHHVNRNSGEMSRCREKIDQQKEKGIDEENLYRILSDAQHFH